MSFSFIPQVIANFMFHPILFDCPECLCQQLGDAAGHHLKQGYDKSFETQEYLPSQHSISVFGSSIEHFCDTSVFLRHVFPMRERLTESYTEEEIIIE